MTDQIEPTQADREAAAEIALALQMDHAAHLIRKGGADQQPLVQAFAAHRQSEYARGAEYGAMVAEEVASMCAGPNDRDTALGIAKAIRDRALKDQPR